MVILLLQCGLWLHSESQLQGRCGAGAGQLVHEQGRVKLNRASFPALYTTTDRSMPLLQHAKLSPTGGCLPGMMSEHK